MAQPDRLERRLQQLEEQIAAAVQEREALQQRQAALVGRTADADAQRLSAEALLEARRQCVGWPLAPPSSSRTATLQSRPLRRGLPVC
jgi:regulator of protease activity HflC (stomatin/prohibitin superfamily)